MMNSRQRIVGISTAITLFLHSALTILLASISVAQAQSFADHDRVLICTGSYMKWVSLSQTELAGEFVFIDPPEEASSLQDEHACATQVLLQLTDCDDVLPWAGLTSRLALTADKGHFYCGVDTRQTLDCARPRAPPFTAFTA